MDRVNLIQVILNTCNIAFNENDTFVRQFCNPRSRSLLTKFHIIENTSITLYVIIFALGIIGNGLVIWIAGFRMKKTISATWFLNLAIADFLCCFSLILRILDISLDDGISCVSNTILFLLNMSASVLLLTAMSIDRCVSVMWPFWAKIHRTCKLVRISAAIIWVLSVLWTVFVFMYYICNDMDPTEWCVSLWRVMYHVHYDTYRTIQLIRLFIMFVIPFLIILISYVIIYFKLKNTKRSRRSQRPYRIITAIILCFFLCWFPYYIWPLTPMYSEMSHRAFIFDIIVVNLACFNSCINPIIYVFMSQDIKPGFFRSIPSRINEALNDQPNDLSREGENDHHG
ncbi:C3a anaphylatoxin chemotactic receptor-like [Hyla sarda]|uniref:C3a anaphylatoxin chemotactic receptor-like n=1 Tax=Hyla sarda TaxID=327740 RepID=UPI0024C3D7DC|nr:C3a anaphylatoxin chemotactic receptor-like [Hyla sarda]XP_056399199.1 C3a anaphylatoxin chemotactic receptor-like [Hyla sarda]XP_056399200.1 C3a anaphylatoxin chemotactic receptor-like [Hyla sarda]